jgi:phage terminase large subunit-like protein
VLVSRLAADKLFDEIEFDPAEFPDLAGETFPDYPRMASWYCEQIVAGKVLACKEEVSACRRYLEMVKEAKSPKSPFYFSDAHVVDFCDFFEKLPHTKGFEGSFVIEPVQCFWAAAVFGFRERETHLRWTRKASIWAPRKNGKTAFGAAVILFCANCEGEVGAECVISAGSESQAHIPYDTIRAMLEAEPDLKKAFGAYDTNDFTDFLKTGGSIKLATARAKNLDGLNPHLVFEEELHAQSIEVINVLETAQAARRNPLVFSISTAGRDVNAPAYDDWKTCLAVLDGRLKAPRLFTAMYAADKEDDENRFSPAVIEKLNPLYGISLNPEALEEEIHKARQSEERLNEYRRTRINVWSRAAGNLINVEDWRACGDRTLSLDAFRGYPMYVGMDLASHSDLNAVCFLVRVGPTIYSVIKYWLPQESPRFRDDRYADQFGEWARNGNLVLTPGNYADQEKILQAVKDEMNGHHVTAIGSDTYQHVFLSGALSTEGYQCFAIPKTAKYITRPTDDVVARTKNTELLQHDANPVSEWCAGNVVGHRDANDNVLPKKEKRMTGASIDGMDALINANAVRMHFEAGLLLDDKGMPPPNPYLNRGLAGYAA